MHGTMTTDRRQRHWTLVNAVCFTLSVLLFGFIVFETEDHPGKVLAKKTYLVYNVGTTLVWCWEVADRWQRDWKLWLESALAVYFLGDSIQVLLDFRYRQQRLTLMIVDLMVNTVGYAYFLSDNCHSARTIDDYETLPESSPSTASK